MGLLDKLRRNAPAIKDKAGDLATSQNAKIDQGIDKAAGLASRATKGKYDEKIDSAADKAKDGVDRLAASDDPQEPPAAGPRRPR